VDLNKLLVQGTAGHLKQTQQRLKFLTFVVKYGQLPISFDQVDILWNSLINQHLTQQECDLGFSWFVSLPQIVKVLPFYLVSNIS
jgi:hypothetical protein